MNFDQFAVNQVAGCSTLEAPCHPVDGETGVGSRVACCGVAWVVFSHEVPSIWMTGGGVGTR